MAEPLFFFFILKRNIYLFFYMYTRITWLHIIFSKLFVYIQLCTRDGIFILYVRLELARSHLPTELLRKAGG